MVIGQVSSGKSSFINSLFGRKLLVPSDRPTDGVVSVIAYAMDKESERAEKILKSGEIQHFDSLDKGLQFLRQQDTPEPEQSKCKEVRLYIHDPLLKKFRIINSFYTEIDKWIYCKSLRRSKCIKILAKWELNDIIQFL